jgi:hypothetical protein
LQNSEAIKILRQFLCTGHINQQDMYGFWKCLPSCIDRAGVRSVIHAIGGFRVAYQALPRSLVAKLEAMDGGRQSAYSVEKVGFNFWLMRPAVEKLKCWRS